MIVALNTDDVVHALTESLARQVNNVELPSLGEIGGFLLALGVILAIGVELKRWVKRRGYRMVLKDRNDKIHALLLEIFQDGLDDALEKGKISRQECKQTFGMLAKKLGLRDLVPKKRIASDVKAELKTARFLREKARREGTEKHPTIPGPPPTVEKFSQQLGKASKFWKKTG